MPLHTFSATDGTVTIGWALPASSADAWAHLTDLAHLPEWLGRPTAGRFKEGATLVVDHGDGASSSSHVTTSVPGHLEMTWDFPDEPSSALTVRADDAGDGCTLTLTHAGLGELTVDYLPDWVTHLTYFEASLRGEPLPSGTFWPLNTTFSALIGPSWPVYP